MSDSVLVMGPWAYGHGADLKTAKKNLQAQGARLSDGYCIFNFTDGRVYQGVDQMGRITWTGNTDPIPAACITEVPRRKARH